ncbi:L-idonate 5-dehydrogenase [Calidifontibacter sp. DB0510]|uniref:L-idonate 5-dehydrogenase n=1 Tax=Metallococcus carri TaxID=1656884 RepID=A0A967B445_9MICO|nr:L-idonate 5-dehydrogenase [Metallococcus carri]NHN54236.1 L-idonate 5-dehydrogenase [Metallococcus carri]NOP36924.1 L-idonate 5-dehydrogenase [Calidifontibacter sp. DB2511S]
MKACVVHGKGDLRLEQLPDPQPRAGEVAVRIAYGGICGSDLHYVHDGRVGDFRIQQPMVLGHEVSGTVAAIGAGVNGPAVGAPVVVHPATPDNTCPECLAGHRNVCRDTRYLGSAARMPHVQGGFSELLVVPHDQVLALPDGLDLRTAALAEPLSVALHAVNRAGTVAGQRVLVTGAGPIGALVVAVLAHRGAAEIVASDLSDTMLQIATEVGATATVRADRAEPEAWPSEVDCLIEASGSAAALSSAMPLVRRRGTIVQLGLLPPDGTLIPGNLLVTRELRMVGAFRFDGELSEAVQLLASGLAVEPIITASFPLGRFDEAFAAAGDRTRHSKVLLDMSGEHAP